MCIYICQHRRRYELPCRIFDFSKNTGSTAAYTYSTRGYPRDVVAEFKIP